ncbi:MAG: R3H domain-containing nucleic acid-binding protein [Acidobacteriota bacterium]
MPATDEHAQEMHDLLEEIIARWGLELVPAASTRDDTVCIELSGGDAPLLSAEDGRILGALQYVVSKISSRLLEDNVRVLLEADGFRADRDADLIKLAEEAAADAKESGQKVRLDPLNAYERRVVHLALRDMEGVRTYSLGRGYLKRVTIDPVLEDEEIDDDDRHDDDVDSMDEARDAATDADDHDDVDADDLDDDLDEEDDAEAEDLDDEEDVDADDLDDDEDDLESEEAEGGR